MRLYFALLLGISSLFGGTSAALADPPRALPVSPQDLTNSAAGIPPPVAPLSIPGGINIQWYGHGFVFLTSAVGVRAAIDPFGPDTVHYHFPEHLIADFVLITHESEDHSAAERLFGNPLIFRSVTAVGLNRANGIPFHGVSLQKDPAGHGVSDTAFSLRFDGVNFCYLGEISQPLLASEKALLGHADVLFLPVGLRALSVNDLNQVVADLQARVIIPINYKTDSSGYLELRPLDEYLSQTKFPVQRFDSSEIVVSKKTLPAVPTLYLLKSP